jgi:hypothetical protein
VAAALDFLLRLAFFAAAPFLLVFIASLFPVTGAVVQVCMALAVFFGAEAVRRLSARNKLAASFFAKPLAFEEHYQQHPPGPFLYYAFYPLLFPYWLAVSSARREFLLFKGYTVASFAILVVTLAVQFELHFPPELGLADFWGIAAWTFLVETAVVLMFLMPIVTTVVHYHLERAPGRLTALLLVGFVSVTVAMVRIERRRDPVVSYATRARVTMRTAAQPKAAEQAQAEALRAASKLLARSKEDVDRDGKVEGEILDAAQDALRSFYKDDEAEAFDLWYTRNGKSTTLVVYFEARRKQGPIWLAMTQKGTIMHDSKQLPRGAFAAMKEATQ